MNPEVKNFLIKKAEEIKEQAKQYYLKKVAAVKIIDQFLTLKEMESYEKNS